MNVEITDYGTKGKNDNFIVYTVSNLDEFSLDYLDKHIEDNHKIIDNDLIITMNFTDKYYPFASDLAHFKFDDFKSREEIEMTCYLSGVLEDVFIK
ncbi:hypothetical protein BGI41_05425 [Methanobrevibacter sp. 87.7]|nr:hypothetical protein BGI41_05425 [Methanobrevibacter sp. 87.7]